MTQHKQSGTLKRVVHPLACGCVREKLVMCSDGILLFRALREAFPDAMWSGSWDHFDAIRAELEAHLDSVTTLESVESKSA